MESLRKKEDFKKTIYGGKRIKLKYLSASLLFNDKGKPRVGIAVSRKTGKSVVRNRIRRRIREAVRAVLRETDQENFGFDMVFFPAREAATAPFEDLKEEVRELIRRGREHIEKNNQ